MTDAENKLVEIGIEDNNSEDSTNSSEEDLEMRLIKPE